MTIDRTAINKRSYRDVVDRLSDTAKTLRSFLIPPPGTIRTPSNKFCPGRRPRSWSIHLHHSSSWLRNLPSLTASQGVLFLHVDDAAPRVVPLTPAGGVMVTCTSAASGEITLGIS
jgi:hypothetical protein